MGGPEAALATLHRYPRMVPVFAVFVRPKAAAKGCSANTVIRSLASFVRFRSHASLACCGLLVLRSQHRFCWLSLSRHTMPRLGFSYTKASYFLLGDMICNDKRQYPARADRNTDPDPNTPNIKPHHSDHQPDKEGDPKALTINRYP